MKGSFEWAQRNSCSTWRAPIRRRLPRFAPPLRSRHTICAPNGHLRASQSQSATTPLLYISSSYSTAELKAAASSDSICTYAAGKGSET